MIRRTLARLDAGVGLLVVAVAFGLLAKGASDDLHGSTHTSTDAQALADTAQTDSLLANIMFGVGGAMIVGSVVLFFVEGKTARSALLESPLPSLGISTNPRTGAWYMTLDGDF